MTIPQPGAPDDRTFYIVLNAASGDDDTDETRQAISQVLTDAGRAHEIVRVDEPERLAEIARQVVSKAVQNKGIVVAAGGDGTLNSVAQATLGSGCEFGVIPQGTFNYFGRAHAIPTEAADAARALLGARPHPVQVGLVNDRVFLVNASLGLYRRSLEDREEQKERHGRSRLVAAWAALITILRGSRPMHIKLHGESDTLELRTLTLFVGNNRMQLERIGLDARPVEDGALVAIVLRPVSSLALLWYLLRGAMGRLPEARGVDTFAFTTLSVTPSDPRIRRLKVATDGEVRWFDTPIEFRVASEPLLLLKSAEPAHETAAQ
jgi:diacylglycerol kinase family enzyme